MSIVIAVSCDDCGNIGPKICHSEGVGSAEHMAVEFLGFRVTHSRKGQPYKRHQCQVCASIDDCRACQIEETDKRFLLLDQHTCIRGAR